MARAGAVASPSATTTPNPGAPVSESSYKPLVPAGGSSGPATKRSRGSPTPPVRPVTEIGRSPWPRSPAEKRWSFGSTSSALGPIDPAGPPPAAGSEKPPWKSRCRKRRPRSSKLAVPPPPPPQEAAASPSARTARGSTERQDAMVRTEGSGRSDIAGPEKVESGEPGKRAARSAEDQELRSRPNYATRKPSRSPRLALYSRFSPRGNASSRNDLSPGTKQGGRQRIAGSRPRGKIFRRVFRQPCR